MLRVPAAALLTHAKREGTQSCPQHGAGAPHAGVTTALQELLLCHPPGHAQHDVEEEGELGREGTPLSAAAPTPTLLQGALLLPKPSSTGANRPYRDTQPRHPWGEGSRSPAEGLSPAWAVPPSPAPCRCKRPEEG